jgi:hypothetical protein
MTRLFLALLVFLAVFLLGAGTRPADQPALEAGFAEVDITPQVGGANPTVYLAGFGPNRKATGVHDPLKARAFVLWSGKQKIAVVSADLVGLFHASVVRVRKELPGYAYVLVSSTHNHEGPDVLGLWGASPLQSGVDPAYLRRVEKQIVRAVRAAEGGLKKVRASVGSVRAPELLRDARLPVVKHDELVALQFKDAGGGKTAGVVVQWNCHPELLGGKNTLLSADHVGYTVRRLAGRYSCPVVYLSGTVGGLMTSLGLDLKNAKGEKLADGTFAKTERYGELVADAAVRALDKAKPVRLAPFTVRARPLDLPMANKVYLLMRQLGVINRQAYRWKEGGGGAAVETTEAGGSYAVRTELAYLRLGELDVACVPGEIYPELVLGKVQTPADPGADFPDAPAEPGLYAQLPGPYRMLVGLANDEIGYIIPKRQWDVKPPFCYGRKKAQYGEMNSLGPDTAPVLCRAFKELVRGKGKK